MKKLTKKQIRLYGVALFMLGLGLAATLIFIALGDNMSYFRTPTEIVSGTYPEKESGRSVRVGGLVEQGSLVHEGDGSISFRITDTRNSLNVRYSGVVPDLFREGQGVVATGKMQNENTMEASQLLAKHDEKYTPPEVTKALEPAHAP